MDQNQLNNKNDCRRVASECNNKLNIIQLINGCMELSKKKETLLSSTC